MKNLRNALMGTSMMMLIATPAFAVDTARTYNSGILVGLFLAFCALIVVMQLMPTLIILGQKLIGAPQRVGSAQRHVRFTTTASPTTLACYTSTVTAYPSAWPFTYIG